MDALISWAMAKSAIIFAAVSGAVIHVTLFWTAPGIAARQFIACVLFGINFGPGLFAVAEHYLPSPFASEGATICATGLCGVYLTEGLVLLAKRWARNPSLPWKKP